MARVNGFALGGGFEMVLGCDIVVACEEASFGLPEALVPHAAGRRHDAAAAADSLPQGDGDAADGSPNPRARAAELGLINEVVPRAGLDEAVQRWVDALLACAPLSQQAIKQVVRRTGTLSPADAQALRLPALVAALQSEDAHEGVLAFQQKRKPQWRGDNDLRDRFRLHRRQGPRVKCCPSTASTRAAARYIHPDECISCGICVSVCPTEAIHDAQELPPHEAVRGDQQEFFGPDVSGLARLAARTACSPRPATIRWSRPIRRAGSCVLSRSVVRAYPRDG